MQALKRILLIADAAMNVTPAFRHAAEIARRASAELHLCIVAHDPLIERAADLVHPDVMHRAQKEYLRERLDWLAAQASTLVERHRGSPVETDVIWAAAPYEAIVAKVLQVRPDLVVVDASANGGAPGTACPTVAEWKILRYVPAPLLLVHPESRQLPALVAAAIDTRTGPDESAVNDAVVQQALRLSLYLGADVHVAHVYPYRPVYKPQYEFLKNVYAEARGVDERAFDVFAERYGVPLQRRHIREGDPARQLGDVVKTTGCGMLVMGSVHRTLLDRMPFGSTAEALLSRMPCDILLVKPADFDGELARQLDLPAIQARYGLGM